MVTLPSLFVSADFCTWSYQCSFIIIIIIIIIIIWRHIKYPYHGPESVLAAKADDFVIVLFFIVIIHLALHGRYIDILNFYLHIRLYYFC